MGSFEFSSFVLELKKLDLERLMSVPKLYGLLPAKRLDGEDQRKVSFFVPKCDDEIAHNLSLFLENVKRKEPIVSVLF